MSEPVASTSRISPLVAEMCQVTGCSQYIAAQLLQGADQDLAVAVDRFYSQQEGVEGRDNTAKMVDDLKFGQILHENSSGVTRKEAGHPDVINISSDSDVSLPEAEEDVNNNLLEQQLVSMFPMIPRHLIREKKLMKTEQRQEAVSRLTETFLGHEGSPENVINDDENEDDWEMKKMKEMNDLFAPFAPSRKELVFMGIRKNRRPDKEIKTPTEPCLAFLKERKFCEPEGEIKKEMERRRMVREQKMLVAAASGQVEECELCLSDNFPCEMAPCQAGHKFCFSCVEMTALQVLGSGKGRVGCLSLCDKEVEGSILKKVLKENIFSKLMVNRQSEELSAAGLENLVSCPFCPYQTIMDNLQDNVIRCLNPECGRDSCRKCKMANHVPLTCDEVIARSRRRLEEELTMSWVRECSNCKIKFERTSGCHMMTCPRCGQMTCYTCRQAVTPGGGGGYQQHARCGDTTETRNNEKRYQEELAQTLSELAQAEKRLKTDLDLFKPGPSK